MDWDDLRFVLAAARAGSALRAGKVLGVNQTTVLRRLEAFEAGLGEPLFEKAAGGRTLTPLGELACETAERMEREALALEAALAARRRSLSGAVRLTTSEGLAGRLVAPCIRAFRREHPDVAVELITAVERLDVARGDADVALRAGSQPEGAGVVARRLPDIHWSVYCSRAYAAERGAPASRAEIAGHEIVGMERRADQLPAMAWLLAAAPGSPVGVRSNSLVSLVSNLRAGLGLGVLPTVIGDAEPELVRCLPPPPEIRSELWLIVREEVKARPHVRAFTDFLAQSIRDALAESAPA